MTGRPQLTKMDDFRAPDARTVWRCYLSDCSPLAKCIKDSRNSYAAWLGTDEARKKGLYIWLYTLSDDRYRFVHVGLCKGGKSTLADRQKVHCRNAFKTDPTYRVNEQACAFGHLKRDGNPINEEAARQFLDRIRVLLMIPEGGNGEDVIASTEGLIAYAAADAFGEGRIERGECQITNTLDKVRKPKDPASYTSVVRALNAVVPMLPERTHDRSRTAQRDR